VSASIPVFCYHNVSDADGFPARRFEEHVQAIADAGFTAIGARELVAGMRGEKPLPGRACVLTFDDCHLSNWTVAAPILRRHGMTATFFCVTDFIGQGGKRPQLPPEDGGPELLSAPESFRRALSTPADVSQFMNEAELRAMMDDFGFEIHGHSARHQGCFRDMRLASRLGDAHAHWSAAGIYPAQMLAAPDAAALPLFQAASAYVYGGFWPVRGGAQAGGGIYYRRRSEAERLAFCRADFARCMAAMRALNGYGDEQYFCWPWGQFDAASEACLREAGFAAAFTLERSANVSGGDVMRIHRIGVGKTKDGGWVQKRLRMYSGSVGARVFFKYLRKRPEISSVLFMTDSGKLSGGSRQMLNNIIGLRESGLRITAVVPPGTELRAALAPLESGPDAIEVVEYADFRRYVRAASFVAELARRVRADVVHTFHAKAYKSAALARAAGGRFRLFINRGVIFPPNTIFALYALAATGVTCNSQVCMAVLRRYRVPDNRLDLVYNSFLPEGGAPPPERRPRKKRGARVLFVGNMGPAKGFDVFAAMAGELVRRGVRDLEYVAAGVKPDEPWRELVPAQARQRFCVLGHLDHGRVLEELMAADILVLPSRQESLPNVLLEAFACSLPVVCTEVGGMPELVRDGVNGFLRLSGDAAGLADAVALLAADPALRARMGRINRLLVTRHLDNAAKTLALLRVYHGERLREPLPIEALAQRVADEDAASEPFAEPPCRRV
jgi:glycosyltransferase involved in cell wall biosynthesis